MKVIRQRINLIKEVPTNGEHCKLHVERCGRICYQSHERIEDDSADKFCKMLFKRKHFAMIEKTNAVFKVVIDPKAESVEYSSFDFILKDILSSPFIKVERASNREWIVGGNWRAWIEQFKKETDEDFFVAMPASAQSVLHRAISERTFVLHSVQRCDPEEIPRSMRLVTVVMKIDRAVSHEIVRHRPASFAQESQRYCAYRKDVEFIRPYFFRECYSEKPITEAFWYAHTWLTEKFYKLAMKWGKLKPQEARAILPNSTATEIAVTADLEEWDHIFYLRTAKDAYPPMRDIMNEVEDTFVHRGYKDKKTYPYF